jgi:2-C-methyl-D-erythritol 4-phosphate cytidylyltransferase
MKSLSVILLAGGKGSRMNSETPKQYLNLRGKAIINYSFEILKTISEVKEIIVVCNEEYQHLFTSEKVKLKFATPGIRRQDSVYSGFKKVSDDAEFVLIHDGARPFLNKTHVEQTIEQAHLHGAATLAIPLKFTVKLGNSDGTINKTLDRESLFEIQTPQIIRKSLLKDGFKNAIEHDLEVTDDVSLIEHLNLPVKLVMASYQNIKITTREDLLLAETILDNWHA